MRFQRFIHMVLLLGVCGLGWQVFVAWSGVRPPVAAEAPADLNTAIPSLPRAELRTGRRLAGVITAKNLFAPDRRPARKILPPNPDEQKIVIPPPDHLKLVGVFMADGRLEALFADASKGGKVTRVRSGDSFDAYQLTRLTHSDATLALGAGGEEVSLSLNIQKSSEAAKAPRTKQPRRQAAATAPDAEGKAETAASPLVLGSDAVQTAATQAAEKTDAEDGGKDEATTIRQNIRQLQRRLREIRRRRARERREARDAERAASPERRSERQSERQADRQPEERDS